MAALLEIAQRVAQIGTWVADLETGNLQWSEHTYRIFGQNPADFTPTQEAFFALCHEQDRDALRRIIDQAAAEGGSYETEYRFVRPDGEVRWARAYAGFGHNRNGSPVRMLGLIQDITEGRAARKEIELGRARFSTIVNSALDCIITIDAHGSITEWNPAAERTFGYTRAEVLGYLLHELVMFPEQAAAHAAALSRLAAGAAPHLLGQRIEMRARKKDGTPIEVELTITRSNHDGPLQYMGFVRDITQRKRTEEKLHRRDEFLAALLRNSSDAVHIVNDNGIITFTTEAAARVVGWDVSEMVGKPGADFVHPDDVAEALAGLQQVVLNPGEPRTQVMRIKHKTLGWRWMECVAANHRDDPTIAGIVVNFRDITQRHEQEQKLRERDEFLGALLRHAGHGVHIMDERGMIKWAGESIERVTGSKPQDWVGRHGSEVTCAEDGPACEAALMRLVQDPQSIEYLTVRLICADKSLKWVDVIATNRLSEPAIRGFVVNFYDASSRMAAEAARHESEERYRKLIYYSNDAVVLADRDGRTTFASPAIEQITGYAPAVFVGLDYSENVHAADLAKLRDVMAKVLASQGDPHRTMHRFRHRDGSWVWVENTTTNLLHEPAIGAIVVNVRDVSERVGLQEQLTHASKMEGIGRLAGGVAHDFNNLLTAIIGYAQLLEARLEHDSVSNAQAQRIMDAAGRATDLTRQLLAFSRRQIMQPVMLNLNSRTQGMESLLRHIIGEDIELKINAAADLSLVRADPSQMDQVIMNLSVNARDAMPQGGRLSIETRNVHLDSSYADTHPEVAPGDYVMLAVSDTGIGMDAATKARVFEPFFTTKGPGRGTGLGLAMVYGIVRQSGGHIWLYSEPNKGTVFKIYMPATTGEETITPAVTSKPMGGAETILLAEDESAVRTLVSEVLSQAGYRVLAAPSGPDALKLMENAAIKLLLSDVVMPGMSGSELAKQATALQPGLKVIFMSGYTDDAIVDHGTLISGVEFLQKPFSPAVLLRRVRDVLDA